MGNLLQRKELDRGIGEELLAGGAYLHKLNELEGNWHCGPRIGLVRSMCIVPHGLYHRLWT